MKTIKKLLPIIIVTILFSSCATFDKSVKRIVPITEQNLSRINGVYDNNPIILDSLIQKYKMRRVYYGNFLKEIDRKLGKDRLRLDSLKNYTFEIKVLDNKRLSIKYLEEDIVIREIIRKYNIRKNGYLYLRNKNLQPIGVPYILGGLDIKRTRFSLKENGNLNFDITNDRSAAFLMMLWAGRSWEENYEYSKIKNL